MGPQILLGEGALQSRINRPQEDEQKRAECLKMILLWTGAKLDRGEYESVNVNAKDKKKYTCLHYAAAAGMMSCVEVGNNRHSYTYRFESCFGVMYYQFDLLLLQLLLKSDADLFVENDDRETPCDSAERRHHKELALRLESQMVFSQDAGVQDVEAEYATLDHREVHLCFPSL